MYNVYFHCKRILLVQLLNTLNVWELSSKCSLTPVKQSISSSNSNIKQKKKLDPNGVITICIVCDKVANANDWQGSYKYRVAWIPLKNDNKDSVESKLCPTKDLSFQGSEFRSLVPFYITAIVDEWISTRLSLRIFKPSVIRMTLKWKLCKLETNNEAHRPFQFHLYVCSFVSFRFVFFPCRFDILVHSQFTMCTVYIQCLCLCMFCIAFPDRNTIHTIHFDINVYRQI